MSDKNKLMNELIEILDKIIKLRNFTDSEEFEKLSCEMQNLLMIQRGILCAYGQNLKAISQLLEKEGK